MISCSCGYSKDFETVLPRPRFDESGLNVIHECRVAVLETSDGQEDPAYSRGQDTWKARPKGSSGAPFECRNGSATALVDELTAEHALRVPGWLMRWLSSPLI